VAAGVIARGKMGRERREWAWFMKLLSDYAGRLEGWKAEVF
jgi:hypothetical protein